MLCPSCGSLINDNSYFCEQCGAAVNTDQPSTATNTPEYQPVENYAPAYDAPAYDAPAYEAAPVYDAPAYDAAPVYDAPAYNQAPPMYNQYQTPPAYQPTYVGYSQNAAEPQKRNPGKVCGILSLIFSIISYPLLIAYGLGIYFWIAALILGIVGSSVSKRRGFKNGMAMAGILIAVIPVVALLAFGLLFGAFALVMAIVEGGIYY